MQIDAKLLGVEAYVKSLRTAENTATERAAKFIAPDAKLIVNGNVLAEGREAILRRIAGNWPFTIPYGRGVWSFPEQTAEGYRVDGSFPGIGAGPQSTSLAFSFTGEGHIKEIKQTLVQKTMPEPVTALPDDVRSAINRALLIGSPMTLAYVNEDGEASLSLRGGIQVYSPTQLCLWIRKAKGGLADALRQDGRVSMMFRDGASRTTYMIKAKGHVSDDPAVRDRIYHLMPEVEQNHDIEWKGAAAIFDIISLQGGGPQGNVVVKP